VICWLESQLRAVEWRVVPADSADPLAVEAAEFLSSCMDDMETTFEEFIVEVLSMLPFGFSLFEQTYKQRKGQQEIDGRHDMRRSSRHSDAGEETEAR
jgi:phage gp29-like protein